VRNPRIRWASARYRHDVSPTDTQADIEKARAKEKTQQDFQCFFRIFSVKTEFITEFIQWKVVKLQCPNCRFFDKKIDFLARAREVDPAGVHCYRTGVHSNFLFGSCSQLKSIESW
jgi:hypothetical protein